MSDEIDEFLAETDITALADAVGVLRGGATPTAAERWVEPIPGHRPYDDRRVTEVRRLARPLENAHRAERDERIGVAGGSNIDPNTHPRQYAAWLIEQLTAIARRRRTA